MAAEADTAEDYEVEDVLRDYERSYERKIEFKDKTIDISYEHSRPLSIRIVCGFEWKNG
jgi:hypothetical protein